MVWRCLNPALPGVSACLGPLAAWPFGRGNKLGDLFRSSNCDRFYPISSPEAFQNRAELMDGSNQLRCIDSGLRRTTAQTGQWQAGASWAEDHFFCSHPPTFLSPASRLCSLSLSLCQDLSEAVVRCLRIYSLKSSQVIFHNPQVVY